MLIYKDGENTNDGYIDQVQDAGNIDYIKEGNLYRNHPCKSVLISGASDLQTLRDYTPGTVAYTAGFKAMWQLSPAGEWVSI